MAKDSYALKIKKKETGMKLYKGFTIDGNAIKKNLKKWTCKLTFLMFTAIFTFTGCAMVGTKTESAIHMPEPPKVQMQKDHLHPGLSVLYFHGFYRHIDEMPMGRIAAARGIPGEPIPFLNHQFGEEEMVFKSGKAKGVGMHMDGFILFEKPGDYVFQANTNDGFRLLISGLRIINDPTVHSDRMSEKGIVRVSVPGWYPLQILYFQRKGTATIELFWKKPEDNEKVIVPAEAYAHTPRQE
jgi:hypothetical protein